MKKQQRWTKFRHRVVRNIAFFTLGVYARLRYRIRITPLPDGGKRPYLILMNHQTAFDQFFVGMTVRGPIYYVASEDIFSNGFISSLLRYLVAPIPIKKQTTDVHAVINCLRVAKEGGTIAIAPEGNRTYSGQTGYMNPAIAALARKLQLPIALLRIEGGYGVHPRWSDVVRRGHMRAYVSRVVEPAEYNELTSDALCALIAQALYVDEARDDACFYHKRSAEYIERALYTCPFCGLSVLRSHKDMITCTTCGRQVRYLPDLTLQGVGFTLPFRFVADWYAHQQALINALDVTQHTAQPLFRDAARLFEVIVYKKKQLLCKSASLALYGDRIELDCGAEKRLFRFDDISGMAVLGKNKLNVYIGKQIYQCKGDKRFNALKYVNLFYRYKNIIKGEPHGEFLGL